MTLEQFYASLADQHPPSTASPLLAALWHDRRGDWERAHDIAQEIKSDAGSLVHAYLHRKEGDLWNADYWYRRAGARRPDQTLAEEWEAMVRLFIPD